jgi:hypothetical protein
MRERTLHEVELPSGVKAAIRLPNLVDCIAVGDVPLPVLEKMQAAAEGVKGKKDAAPDLTAEDYRSIRRFHKAAVRLALYSYDLEPLEEADTAEDVAEALSDEDFEQIRKWALREEPLPGNTVP